MKKLFTVKNIILGILFILVDFVIYVFLGLMMLQYEDFYDESKDAYWSLQSMTTGQKFAYISYYILIILNWILVGYIIYKLL